MVASLLPVAVWAEMHTMTLKAVAPLADVNGNPLDPGDIVGYEYYISLDIPVTDVSEFVDAPITKDVIRDSVTGDVIDDGTELELVYDFPNAAITHAVYTTVVVKGKGGLNSVPFMPVQAFSWEVVEVVGAEPNPAQTLRAVHRMCSTGDWRWVCNMLGL